MPKVAKNPFESARAYKLDDAISEACDLLEPEKWKKVISAIQGDVPATRSPLGKALRKVRNTSQGLHVDVLNWQIRAITSEMFYWTGRQINVRRVEKAPTETVVIDLRKRE